VGQKKYSRDRENGGGRGQREIIFAQPSDLSGYCLEAPSIKLRYGFELGEIFVRK